MLLLVLLPPTPMQIIVGESATGACRHPHMPKEPNSSQHTQYSSQHTTKSRRRHKAFKADSNKGPTCRAKSSAQPNDSLIKANTLSCGSTASSQDSQARSTGQQHRAQHKPHTPLQWFACQLASQGIQTSHNATYLTSTTLCPWPNNWPYAINHA